MIIEEVIRLLDPPEAYFWAVHGGSELDLFLPSTSIRLGIEVKRADAPVMTRSMHIALADLELDRLVVVHPGKKPYSLSDKVHVMPAATLADPAAARFTLLGE